MSYLYGSGFIGKSSTRSEVLGEDLSSGGNLAVMFDESGCVVVANSTKAAVGLLLSSTEENLVKGDSVSVLVKDIGLMKMAEAVEKGDLICVNEEGCGVVASSGDVVFGRAFTSCTAEGSLVQVMVFSCGAVMS